MGLSLGSRTLPRGVDGADPKDTGCAQGGGTRLGRTLSVTVMLEGQS